MYILESSQQPIAFRWHHDQNANKMQLIPTVIHNAVAHSGGGAVIKYLNKFSKVLSVAISYVSAVDLLFYGEQMARQGCNNGNMPMCSAATMFGAQLSHPNAI